LSITTILIIATFVIAGLLWRFTPAGEFRDKFRFMWDSEGVPIAFLAAVVITILGSEDWIVPGAAAFAALWCLVRMTEAEAQCKRKEEDPQ
jgi:hypothetical protein